MKNTNNFKDFLKYTSLNVMGMIGISCYILADTFFISLGLGANGLTALNLAIPVYSFIHGSGLMLGMGGATRYSIFRSQKNTESSKTIFTHTISLALILSCLFFFAGLFFTEPITRLLGANREVFQMTATYLRVILLFSPMFILNQILICFVRNDGSPRLSMTAMLTGSISNIILDYLFIFPLGMGIFGAVLATGLSPVISILVLSWHFFKKQNSFFLVRTGISPKTCSTILSVGFPSLVTEVSSGIVMIIFNMIILRLNGNIGVAAYGVIANLSLVVTAIFTGIAQGVQPLISSAYGNNDTMAIRNLAGYAAATILLLSSIIYLAIFFGADPIALAFNSERNAQMQQMAVSGLLLYFTSAFFVSFNIVVSVFFTSTDTPVPAHMISILRGFIVIIPVTFLLSSLWEITGVWLAFPVTELLVSLVGIAFLYFYRKKLFGTR